jgi:YggT family protein
MDNPYATDATVFLIRTVFGLFLMLVMLRLLLQMVRADFYNPISQFIVRATSWSLKPLRRIIPGLAGIDLASVVLLLAVQMLSIFLISLSRGMTVSIAGIAVLAVAELINLVFTIYLITIIAMAVLSWIGPGTYNPLTSLLYTLNEPVLRPIRRLIPVFSGIDLSPLIALIAIQLLKILLVGPIFDIAASLG